MVYLDTMPVMPAWFSWLIVVSILWTLPWKAVALWKSARNGDKPWFILLLVLNTLGILEIFYIFVFSKRKSTEKDNLNKKEKNTKAP